MKKIIIITDYYLPGYKAGGPPRTISNLISNLSSIYDFWIITKDRDLGDLNKYDSINTGVWSRSNNSNIFYVDVKNWNPIYIRNILNNTVYDLLYLNSFFSPISSFSILIMMQLGLIRNNSILIAPRGQFSTSALTFNRYFKLFYIFLFKNVFQFINIFWQASSYKERNDILSVFKNISKERIFIAPNMVENKILDLNFVDFNTNRQLKLVFFSRISPMKNLIFLLNVLKNISCDICLDIIGPIEDLKYFNSVLDIKFSLPKNITVNVLNAISPRFVMNTLSKYDLFVLPTLGENFGQAIFESLKSGTPVLISDNTPWIHQNDGSITVLRLEINLWINEIEKFSMLDARGLYMRKISALNFAKNYIEKSNSKILNEIMFNRILN